MRQFSWLVLGLCLVGNSQACEHDHPPVARTALKSEAFAQLKMKAQKAEHTYHRQPSSANLKAWTVAGLELTNHLAQRLPDVHDCHCHSKK